MTIAYVQSVSNAVASNTATATFGSNVTVGNLIVVFGSQTYTVADSNYVAGDCQKTGGTSSIDAPTLDQELFSDYVQGKHNCAIWSFLVTGSGSLTIQVGDVGAATNICMAEFSSTFGWTSERLDGFNETDGPGDDGTSAATGTVLSSGSSLFFAGLAVSAVTAETLTEDPTFTLIAEPGVITVGWHGANIQYRIVGTSQTDQGTWTLGGSNVGWIAGLAVYAEPSVVNTTIEVPRGPLR